MPNDHHEVAPVSRPEPDEYAPFYAGYVAEVPDGADPLALLKDQLTGLPGLLDSVTADRSLARYAPGKWSVREVVGHLCDVERVFAYRLLRIARADPTPLPGFDENAWVSSADFDNRDWSDLRSEWAAVRRATLALAHGLSGEAWRRMGNANGMPISARALLYIIPGHTRHHVDVLRDRYRLGNAAPHATR